jgi:beta-D-xylosidase 4
LSVICESWHRCYVTIHSDSVVTYLRCYTDAVERKLDGKQTNITKNDAQSCGNYCGYLGYRYSTMEYTT